MSSRSLAASHNCFPSASLDADSYIDITFQGQVTGEGRLLFREVVDEIDDLLSLRLCNSVVAVISQNDFVWISRGLVRVPLPESRSKDIQYRDRGPEVLHLDAGLVFTEPRSVVERLCPCFRGYGFEVGVPKFS